MVVGGGPAGMEAARIAALRGHNVTLYEKNGAVGGLLDFASTVKGPHENLSEMCIRDSLSFALSRHAMGRAALLPPFVRCGGVDGEPSHRRAHASARAIPEGS